MRSLLVAFFILSLLSLIASDLDAAIEDFDRCAEQCCTKEGGTYDAEQTECKGISSSAKRRYEKCIEPCSKALIREMGCCCVPGIIALIALGAVIRLQ